MAAGSDRWGMMAQEGRACNIGVGRILKKKLHWEYTPNTPDFLLVLRAISPS